jgi:hypothetical protein
MLRRYPDAIRVFVQILNFILRMRQYHTRSYQYDQVRQSNPTSRYKILRRPDQQNGRSHVRIVCHLQRPLAESIGRQHPQHRQRPLRRPIRQAIARVRVCMYGRAYPPLICPHTETKAYLRSKSSSFTHAPNSSLPTRRRTRTRSSSRRTRKTRRQSPHSAISHCSWRTCARRRPCRRSAASSSCTPRSTQPNSQASSTRTRRRWCSR